MKEEGNSPFFFILALYYIVMLEVIQRITKGLSSRIHIPPVHIREEKLLKIKTGYRVVSAPAKLCDDLKRRKIFYIIYV